MNLGSMEDRDILNRIRQSDQKAFEGIFRKYFHLLHEYANFYIGSSQLAEDIVQDVFLKLWAGRGQLTIHSSLKGYLFRCIHNNCIQYLRHMVVEQKHRALHQAKLEEAATMNRLFFESGLTKLFENDIESLVNKAIDELPEKTREIYVLSRRKYLKNSQIAKTVNLTEKSVEYHISRALELLRKYLMDYLPVIFVSIVIIL